MLFKETKTAAAQAAALTAAGGSFDRCCAEAAMSFRNRPDCTTTDMMRYSVECQDAVFAMLQEQHKKLSAVPDYATMCKKLTAAWVYRAKAQGLKPGTITYSKRLMDWWVGACIGLRYAQVPDPSGVMLLISVGRDVRDLYPGWEPYLVELETRMKEKQNA